MPKTLRQLQHMMIKSLTMLNNLSKINHIEKSTFEFQMLYGFRNELAEEIAEQGYHFTVYVPYGNDWFAYFMRRLAETSKSFPCLSKFISTEALKKLA